MPSLALYENINFAGTGVTVRQKNIITDVLGTSAKKTIWKTFGGQFVKAVKKSRTIQKGFYKKATIFKKAVLASNLK